MAGRVYLYLFILCGILSQEIFGSFLEDDIGESSNVLVREKRVINRIPGEDVPLEMGVVTYVVNIRKNKRLHCLGTILSRHTVITAARCVALDLKVYEILSGSTASNHGLPHNITHKAMYGHNPSRSSTFLTGIALITVNPPFRYRNTVNKIGLHEGLLLTGMHGTISGWGSYVYGGECESKYSLKLRSINVPIISNQRCRDIYHAYFPITEEDFCTFHEKKLCGHTDAGGPFVIDNQLVGVHIGGIETAGNVLPIKPDVFVLLQHLEYGQWISRNIVIDRE